MRKRIAVVTGASSGLGREYVRLLAQDEKISEIWAIARRREKLAALKTRFGPKIVPLSIDLSHSENLRSFREKLEKEKPLISWLINSAGFAKFCAYGDISVEESVNMIGLNCGGVAAMGLLCIPYMKKGGHILNISSQASFQPLPYLNLYSATKAFVRNYSRALNVELMEKGIAVTAVCPGWMDTALFSRAEIGAKKAPRRFAAMTSPEKVAAKSLRDAQKGKDISVYGLSVKSAHLAAKLLPQKAMMRLWLFQQGL